jgi:hypothetical protein
MTQRLFSFTVGTAFIASTAFTATTAFTAFPLN